MNPAILTFIGILVFTSGLVVGYIAGHDSGIIKGYGAGWSAAMTEVRRVLARTRETA